jgi:hypothetical protein
MTCKTLVRRRTLLGALASTPLMLAGCASPQGATSSGGAALAEAPTYRVGDRWTYHIRSRFRAVGDAQETMEVTAIGADGIVASVVSRGGGVDVTRTERWSAPGLVVQGMMMDVETRRFAKPLERFLFPLSDGQSWNQWVEQVNETARTQGSVNRYVAVRRMEQVTVRAGTFDAVRMNVLMRLDDETWFRWETVCNHMVWYAPAVRGVVREDRRAEYREKGSPLDAPRISQNEIVELESFTPGR